jgi:hypothetical protein
MARDAATFERVNAAAAPAQSYSGTGEVKFFLVARTRATRTASGECYQYFVL